MSQNLHHKILSNELFLLRGKARIINTYGTDFEALAGDGKIVVEIENTGDISGDFSVRLILIIIITILITIDIHIELWFWCSYCKG